MVLLDVEPGTERRWVPKDQSTPVINLPGRLAASLIQAQLAVLAEVARQHGGLLRITDVFQPNWKQPILVIDTGA